MRTFIVCLIVTILSFGLVVTDAAAKRFGGGRSFGVQRSSSSLFASTKTPYTKSFGQQSNTRKWGGVLGGLLAGGLLASLLMGNGVGAGLLSWLAIGALAALLFNIFRNKIPNKIQTVAPPVSSNNNFDSEAFLRDAKVMFLRLQTAYDQKNRQDLSSFTAPEVFAEIEMQLNERGDEDNVTQVIDLNNQLLDYYQQNDSTIASVLFTGTIKENNAETKLNEIWHFRQFIGSNNWVIGGIQQPDI